MKIKVHIRRPALILSITIISMLLLGGLAMSSGTAGFTAFKNQMIWAYTGVIGAMTVCLIGYKYIAKLSVGFIIISAVLLILARLDVPADGAYRWTRFHGYCVQPSEFAKLAVMLFLAWFCTARQDALNSFTRGMTPVLSAIAVICGLLAICKDWGSAVMLLATSGVMLATAGARRAYFMIIAAGLAGLLICGKYLNQGINVKGGEHQIWSSLLALGAGYWGGLGFIAVSLVILGYIVIALSSFYISIRSEVRQGKLLGLGITAMITIQALMNILCSGTFVGTGITAPFISYGGDNLMVSIMCIGLILSIAMDSGQDEDKVLVDDEG